MNAIVQTKRILPEERAKTWNQVTRKTVAIGMITDESIYSITSKITTTNVRLVLKVRSHLWVLLLRLLYPYKVNPLRAFIGSTSILPFAQPIRDAGPSAGKQVCQGYVSG